MLFTLLRKSRKWCYNPKAEKAVLFFKILYPDKPVAAVYFVLDFIGTDDEYPLLPVLIQQVMKPLNARFVQV